MKIEEILQLIESVNKYNFESFVYEKDGEKIEIKKGGCTVPKASFRAAEANVEVVQENTAEVQAISEIRSDKVIASPLVGTYYKAPSPEAKPFVNVGDTVKKGQVLGIIEAMKLMNEIESEYDGVVEAILVNDGDIVEYGQALYRIR